jgi:hypothetical protein
MSLEQNKALCLRWHMEIFKKQHLGGADEIIAPGFVWHHSLMPVPPGPEGAKQIAKVMLDGFSPDEISEDFTVAEGDKVVNRWTGKLTHRGEYLGIPATGKQVTVTGVDIFRVEGGKIAELWQEADWLGLLQQLGAIPAPAQAGR